MVKDKINRKNLQKLATFLAYGDLPEGVEFDMSEYAAESSYFHPAATCGSSGCAVGFGPFAGIRKWKRETWGEYAQRSLVGKDVPLFASTAFLWCFSGDWADVDNTPLGAAKRIQYLLDGGEIPERFHRSSCDISRKDVKIYKDVIVRRPE